MKKSLEGLRTNFTVIFRVRRFRFSYNQNFSYPSYTKEVPRYRLFILSRDQGARETVLSVLSKCDGGGEKIRAAKDTKVSNGRKYSTEKYVLTAQSWHKSNCGTSDDGRVFMVKNLMLKLTQRMSNCKCLSRKTLIYYLLW